MGAVSVGDHTLEGAATMQNVELAARIQREKRAFNEGTVWQESHKIHRRFHHVFECANTLAAESFFEAKLAQCCPGSHLLEYGCLDGALASKYHSLGARSIVGIDISEVGVETANRNHGRIGEFLVCDAHDLRCIPDGGIDFVVGRAILHHLDFERAIREVKRVLRAGGTALFVEPLYDNPASKVFRALTPQARTRDERPLSRRQIEWANRLFTGHDHHFCNLVSTPIGMLTPLLFSSAQNPLLNMANRLDRALEQSRFRYWMRMAYLSWTK